MDGNMAINGDHHDLFGLVNDLLVSKYSVEQSVVDKALELVVANPSTISYLLKLENCMGVCCGVIFFLS